MGYSLDQGLLVQTIEFLFTPISFEMSPRRWQTSWAELFMKCYLRGGLIQSDFNIYHHHAGPASRMELRYCLIVGLREAAACGELGDKSAFEEAACPQLLLSQVAG